MTYEQRARPNVDGHRWGDDALRYPPTPSLPPVNVAVRVSWGWWTGRAARIMCPKEKRRRWVTWRDGEAEHLPPRRHADAWGDEPDSWWPEDADQWPHPLPDPLPRLGGALWSSRTSFGAVDEAEAADLAREMEHERAHMQGSFSGGAGSSDHGAGAERSPEAPERQWWLDPFAVTRSSPGAISVREAEGRVMRAFLTERWVRVERPADRTFSGVLAGLAQTIPLTAAELAIADPIVIRAEPTGADWDDLPVVITWLRALAMPGRRLRGADQVLRLRAVEPALSWRRIGRIMSRHHATAEALYARALAEITDAANGCPTAGGIRVRDRLAAVQQANLSHRRGW